MARQEFLPTDTLPQVETKLDANFTELYNSVSQNETNKVDKVSGKGLSTNDYTNGDKTKVDNLPADVNADLDTKLPLAGGTMTGGFVGAQYDRSGGTYTVDFEGGSFNSWQNRGSANFVATTEDFNTGAYSAKAVLGANQSALLSSPTLLITQEFYFTFAYKEASTTDVGGVFVFSVDGNTIGTIKASNNTWNTTPYFKVPYTKANEGIYNLFTGPDNVIIDVKYVTSDATGGAPSATVYIDDIKIHTFNDSVQINGANTFNGSIDVKGDASFKKPIQAERGFAGEIRNETIKIGTGENEFVRNIPGVPSFSEKTMVISTGGIDNTNLFDERVPVLRVNEDRNVALLQQTIAGIEAIGNKAIATREFVLSLIPGGGVAAEDEASVSGSATDSETTFIDATSGDITITLPDSSTFRSGAKNFKRVDGSDNTVTIATSASQTIDGQLFSSLSQYDNLTIQKRTSTNNWSIL